MKAFFLFTLCYFPLVQFCQERVEGPWAMEFGATSNTFYKEASFVNIRCMSPRFKCNDDDWTEEMEKHPERYKKARFMFELTYAPPFKVFCGSVNLQYRILKLKRLTLEAYGGLKFVFAAPNDFIPNYKVAAIADKTGWYINEGLICQLDLGVVAPFADIGYDGIITIGTEVNLRKIYKKPKRRYNLHAKET